MAGSELIKLFCKSVPAAASWEESTLSVEWSRINICGIQEGLHSHEAEDIAFISIGFIYRTDKPLSPGACSDPWDKLAFRNTWKRSPVPDLGTAASTLCRAVFNFQLIITQKPGGSVVQKGRCKVKTSFYFSNLSSHFFRGSEFSGFFFFFFLVGSESGVVGHFSWRPDVALLQLLTFGNGTLFDLFPVLAAMV